jgi:hypothetical protein
LEAFPASKASILPHAILNEYVAEAYEDRIQFMTMEKNVFPFGDVRVQKGFLSQVSKKDKLNGFCELIGLL